MVIVKVKMENESVSIYWDNGNMTVFNTEFFLQFLITQYIVLLINLF